jgi:ADP-ribosylglycohydrolase
MMIGAIVGDMVGSIWEFDYKKDEYGNAPLVTVQHDITDDSILTCSTAHALLHEMDFNKYYFEFAIKNGQVMGGYGGRFVKWLYDRENREAYGSWGNGSAMRVSPVGWLATSEESVLELAKKSAEVTHNHPEGIKGAQAIAWAIFKLRNGMTKTELKIAIEEKFEYNLDFDLFNLFKTYQFRESCQETVPQAIFCFLEGESFEEVMRNVLYIGGDTDTIGAIAGSLAEAVYTIPKFLKDEALKRLEKRDPILFETCQKFTDKYCTDAAFVGCEKPRNFIRTLSIGEILRIDFQEDDLFISFINHGEGDTLETIKKSGIFNEVNVNKNLYLPIYADDFGYNEYRDGWLSKFLFFKDLNPFHLKEYQAQKIINKIKERNYGNIYIQCEYGQSRSVSTAHFIHRNFLPEYRMLTDIKEIRNQYIFDLLKNI